MKKYFLITFLGLFSCTCFAPKKNDISLESANSIQEAKQMYVDYNKLINEDRDKDPKDKLDDRRCLDSIYLIKVSSIISSERSDIMNSRVSAKEKISSINKLIDSFEEIIPIQNKNNFLVVKEISLTRVELPKLNLLSAWDERRSSLDKAINEYIKRETEFFDGRNNNLDVQEIFVTDSSIIQNEENIKKASYNVKIHATYTSVVNNMIRKFNKLINKQGNRTNNKELTGESTWIVECLLNGSPITNVEPVEDNYTKDDIR